MKNSIVIILAIFCFYLGSDTDCIAQSDSATYKVDLNPELRKKVENLKKSATREPTSENNIAERVDVLWDWANVFALTGGSIPIDLPPAVSIIRGWPMASSNPLYSKLVDAFIHELQIKDEQPEAIGTVVLDSNGPFMVDSWQTIKQTYTVGKMPMVTGGGVMLGQQLFNWLDRGRLQIDYPTNENYVTIQSSNPSVEFEKTTTDNRGTHGGFFRTAYMPTFKITKGTLNEGDTLTVIYGDRSGGSRGYRVQSFTNDRLLLPLYVDLEGTGIFLTPEWPGIEIIGGEVKAVVGFAPSIVKSGASFELSVRSEDFLYNQASGTIPTYEVFLNGKLLTTIPGGTKAITVLSNLVIREPGIHRASFRSLDGQITGESNPIWVQKNPKYGIYWGETHGHSGFAEGQGSLDGFYRFGRDEARLDFLCLSEHDLWMDDFEWKAMQGAVRKFKQEGVFIPFLGYEWTVQAARGGHHNVFFRTPDHDRVPNQEAVELTQLYEGLHKNNDPKDVLIIPHAHQPGDWTTNDPKLERLVEMYSMHGSFEWFGNMYLQHGHEIGFVAASDDHRGHPGYSGTLKRGVLSQFGGLAAVIAPQKTTDAIFSALRNLSVYATSGKRMILDVNLNGYAAGTQQPFTRERRLFCRAIGTAPIESIDVIKNGEMIFSREYLNAALKSHSWVRLAFASSSRSEWGQVPRQYRTWEGTLTVKGARIVSVTTPGFENHNTEKAEIDPNNPNQITFYTQTRGREDIMLIELEGANLNTEFHIHLNSQNRYYAQAGSNSADIKVSLKDILDGRLEHGLEEGDHTDKVILQNVNRDGKREQAFQYTDIDSPSPGDYYYFRVTQLDGACAWSSPFWVGNKKKEDTHKN